MIDDRSSRSERALNASFERYLQDKGKGRGGEGGSYRRNAARELERFAEWAGGERGDEDWTGIVPEDAVFRGGVTGRVFHPNLAHD